MPECILQLKQLQTLWMWGNQISQLPQELFQLPLTLLDISNNNITEIPPQIGKLKQLQYLDISNNPLTALPQELWGLQSLTHLWMHSLQLSVLP